MKLPRIAWMVALGLVATMFLRPSTEPQGASLKAVGELIQQKAQQAIAAPVLAELVTVYCDADKLEGEAQQIMALAQRFGGIAIADQSSDQSRLLIQIAEDQSHAFREELTGRMLAMELAPSRYLEVLLKAKPAQ